MTKKRGDSDDEFDPFDDLLDDADLNLGSASPADDDDDLDILKMAEADDDLLDEIEKRPRRASSGGGGGIDIGALIGSLIQVILVAVIAVVIFVLLGAGIVIGGRAVGVIPGGAVNLTFSEALSSIVPTQPPAPPTSEAAVPTSAPASAATTAPEVQPTAVVDAATSAPLSPSDTPTPECRQEDTDRWWEQQKTMYNIFTTITPEFATSQQNPGAYVQQLGYQRGYSSNVPTNPCTAIAQDALVRLEDATIARVSALTSPSGVDPNALAAAVSNLEMATADLTASLWELGIVQDDNSPVVAGVPRGSADACGAGTWLSQVETIFAQFNSYASQTDVASMQAPAVREQIDKMVAAQTNASQLPIPACANVPAQLLQEVMSQQISVFENQLAARPNAAAQAQDAVDRLTATFRAWVSWLKG